MTACTHTRIEDREQHDDDMHCAGWTCVDCGHEGIGECHHRSWCRSDFCGVEPAPVEVRVQGAVGG
jgi:hypothetical protein